MAGILYLIATPIGNLKDISLRAVETLKICDFIAAEDTRVSGKLLAHLEIKKPLVSYYEHNKRQRGEEIVERLRNGENGALITDAGMPAISDPGEDLVALCTKQEIRVSIIPGPSAAVSALAVSGLPTGRFCFEGFLSVNKKNREAHLFSLKEEKRTMIFYEAPHKLLRTLEDLEKFFGDREITIVRELTKLHEEVIHATVGEALAYYLTQKPKGEFVLVLKGAEPKTGTEEDVESQMREAMRMLREQISAGMSLKEAAKQVAERLKISKNGLYRAYLEQSKEAKSSS